MGGRVVHIERGFRLFFYLKRACEGLKEREDQFELRAFLMCINNNLYINQQIINLNLYNQMKKNLFFAAALLCAAAANAKVWRINYDDNAQADFKTIKLCQAWNGFTEGDTLYMEPGVHNGSSSDNTVSKSCTILGPGWGFQSSANSISELESAIFTNELPAGAKSGNVFISGVVCNSGITRVTTSTCSSLIIEKCCADHIQANANNVTIRSCYLHSGGVSFYNSTSLVSATIVGNIIRGTISCAAANVRLLIDHNTIFCTSAGNSGVTGMNTKTTFSNNILINTASPDNVNIDAFLNPSYSMYNNVISFTTATIEAAEYTGDHTYDALRDPSCTNKIDATAANTFTCHIDDGIVDNAMYFYVKNDAVAKTADSKGGECGAFGGNYPYQLNGRPNGVPYLYDIVVPTHTTNNQLKVSFKVAGNNE